MAKTRKRWGTVVAVAPVVAGTLAIAGQLSGSPNAAAAPAAEEKNVTCNGASLVEVAPPVTNDKATEFALTVAAGTAACDDRRGQADRIIAISYDRQMISGPGTKGTCTDLVIDKPTMEVNWILAGGKPRVPGTISTDQIKVSGGPPQFGKTTVTGGPLAGASVTVAADPSSMIEVAMADCAQAGVSALALATTVTFTPAS